jgi:L-ascorbate metabolism protein UlaG (beta-lactamase superfamily)
VTAALTVLGHATVMVDLPDSRFIIDPILRDRVGYLRRTTAPVPASAIEGVDAVLISHVHHDHLDGPSLRRLGKDIPVIGPRGVRPLLRRMGMRSIRELSVDEELTVGATRVIAVAADHHAVRLPGQKPTLSIGYVLDGASRIYLAGDTDRFAGMQAIGDRGLDVAAVPVSGWGARLPAGHMNPNSAADSLRALRPRIAVPIHWGTLAPVWWRSRSHDRRRKPAVQFSEAAARTAPDVEVRILEDGETLRL